MFIKLPIFILSTLLFSLSTLHAEEKVMHPSMKLIYQAMKETKAITSKELKTLLDEDEDVILLDIREILERAEGQIYAEESFALTRGDLEFYIYTKIQDTDALIVTYCRGGKKGALAAQTLKQLGFNDARYLEGGLRAWANEGYPIETGIGITRLSK